MSNKSYHNPHAENERQLANTYARETVEILFGSAEQPNRRGGCLIVLAVAIGVLVACCLIIAWWSL
jgi:hypothetical protein